MYKPCLFLLATLLFLSQGFAQKAKTYSFTHISKKNGLAANFVNRVVQDDEGYIWIATSNGLQRFDGYRFLTFRYEPSDKSSIPNNNLSFLMIDTRGRLWVETSFGHFGIFDRKTFKFKQATIKVKDENYLRGQKYLFHDQAGNIMIHVSIDLMVTYNEQKNEFAEEHNIVKFPKGWYYYTLHADLINSNKFYIAADSGIAIYNFDTRILSTPSNNQEKYPILDDLKDVRFASAIKTDDQNRVWFMTWDPHTGAGPYMYCYDQAAKKKVLHKFSFYGIIPVYHEPSTIFQQKNGQIWLFGLPFIGEYLEKEKSFSLIPNQYLNEQSISYEKVLQMFEDREQNIWICTNDNGLFVFNPTNQVFKSIRHINRSSQQPGEGTVMSFAETKDHQILMGAWANGIYKFDSSLNSVPIGIKNLIEKNGYSAWGMCNRSNGEIWMGLQGGMILVYDQEKNKAVIHKPAIIDGRTVRRVVEDKNGNIWLGTQSRGIFKWTESKAGTNFDEGLSKIDEVPNTLIHDLMIDRRGYLWVSTIVDGAYKINTLTNKVEDHITEKGPDKKRLLTDGVVSIVDLNDSTIVIASQGLNVLNLRTNTITHITNKDGLPNAMVMTMQKDKQNNLWVALISGLCRINLSNGNISYFDRSDGMINDNFKVGSSYTLSDGRMLFGTTNDFVVFHPDEVRPASAPTNVKISDFKLANLSLSMDSLRKEKTIQLEHDNNSIVIDFASLTYQRKNKLTYYYRLEGLDDDWIRADDQQRAVYTYLPSGRYTFQVRAQNVDGVFSEDITELKIKVNPHFYNTWWFLSLAIFAAVAFLYWLDKLRMQKLRATESIRTRIATSLTEDMSNSLSSINISSELAKTKIDKEPQRIKEYIHQISETSNRMIHSMYDMVWSINPNNDTMQHTIDRMKAYATEIESQNQVDIVFEIEKTVANLELDMQFRYELLAVFKEAIANAAHHADARYIRAILKYRKGNLCMQIEDDGKGFDMNTAALGRGINDMRRRTSAINASFKIETDINTGTMIDVRMQV